MITKRRKGSGMSAELEEKKQKLEAKKNAVQEAYKKSAYKEDFHSWIQNSTWGGPLNTGEFRTVGFSEDEINLLKSNNVMPYTLGNRILRVSTAVVAACISVNNILDD